MKLLDILNEMIDVYSPEELNSKGIEHNIDRDTPTRFRVKLKYKDQYYVLSILPLFNPKRPSINFGSTDENYENLNLNQLLNSPYSSRILAAIFGLIRYWIDKYKIEILQLIESKYNIEIKDEEVENIITFENLIELIKKKK